MIRPVRQVSEDEIRGTCNRLIANGITTITSYYSFSGLSTEQLVRLNEWIGRCSTMLAGGHQIADIALVYPIESMWTRFKPSHHWTDDCPQEARRIENIYRGAGEDLYAACRDFTYVDAQALTEAEVQGNALVHGALRWRVVILPCVDTLPMEAWDKLLSFWRSGGVIVALGVLPENSEGAFPSPEVRAIAREIFVTSDAPHVHTNDAGGAGIFFPFGSEALLPAVIQSVLEPDVRVSDANGPLRATHRHIDGHEVYFVMNDGSVPWEGRIDLAATGEGECWNPADGAVSQVDSAEAIPLRLEPYCGLFFRFRQARPPRRLEVKAGDLPGLQLSAPPHDGPHALHGEFVQATLERGEPFAQWPGLEVWRSDAVITKSDTDTFLFVAFDYPDAVDLRDAACIAVATSVSEPQDASTPVRVILRDTSGVEYIAGADRPLSTPGCMRSFIPMSRFERAGWNQEPQGPLDLSSIATIRVGWGGYYGAEHEHVTFALSSPEAAHPAEQVASRVR